VPIAQPPSEARDQRSEVGVNPVFAQEPVRVPRFTMPTDGVHPDVAYQVVHDELMLDGNARLNLATFVTTWAPAGDDGRRPT
jgi:glutamate decarboxylase